jgi:2-polyprenyl-3-methyl-5-hydroxy-6-metoxy-1,4-benzoquinol methylase
MVKKQKVWETDEYYSLAHKGSMDREHPGMKALFSYAKKAKRILDFGCGDGTRLGSLAKNGKELWGIDISKTAINKAKKKYSKINFIQGEINDVKFLSDFDLIYSAFTLEHTRDTEKILMELVRKLKIGGVLILMAPNYGAPNRASPVAKYNRLSKLVGGLIKDLYRIFWKSVTLDWKEVEPISNMKYEMDFDTTIEPYLGTLTDFLISNKMRMKKADSVWERELNDAKPHQKIFRFLGEFGVYPFKYWGPHLLVVSEKL